MGKSFSLRFHANHPDEQGGSDTENSEHHVHRSNPKLGSDEEQKEREESVKGNAEREGKRERAYLVGERQESLPNEDVHHPVLQAEERESVKGKRRKQMKRENSPSRKQRCSLGP